MIDIKDLPTGTVVYHVANPDFPGKMTGRTKIYRKHGRDEDKLMALVRYNKPHPRFGRHEVYCDPDLLCKTPEEARKRHIPEEIYAQVEGIIES